MTLMFLWPLAAAQEDTTTEEEGKEVTKDQCASWPFDPESTERKVREETLETHLGNDV